MKNILYASVILALSMPAFSATGPYEATVKKIQNQSNVGNPYTTVHLNIDIQDSPCSSTNQFDRFTISTDWQHDVALAALLSGKTLRIFGSGSCESDIERISHMDIWGNE